MKGMDDGKGGVGMGVDTFEYEDMMMVGENELNVLFLYE
jgi:hypothetical protein